MEILHLILLKYIWMLMDITRHLHVICIKTTPNNYSAYQHSYIIVLGILCSYLDSNEYHQSPFTNINDRNISAVTVFLLWKTNTVSSFEALMYFVTSLYVTYIYNRSSKHALTGPKHYLNGHVRAIGANLAHINPVWDACMKSVLPRPYKSCMGSAWEALWNPQFCALINPVWDLHGMPVWNPYYHALINPVCDLHGLPVWNPQYQALINPVWDLYGLPVWNPKHQARVNHVWDLYGLPVWSPHHQALINPVWDLHGLPVWNSQYHVLINPVWAL